MTSPATPAAAEWDGWGTALKPAWEPIIVARKPLVSTVAENVQRYGTGALNVDGCRVGTEDEWSAGTYGGVFGNGKPVTNPEGHPAGRWPANVILDEEAATEAGEWSRYFYTPKASRSERNAGCEGLEERAVTDEAKWAAKDRRSGTTRQPTEWQNKSLNQADRLPGPHH